MYLINPIMSSIIIKIIKKYFFTYNFIIINNNKIRKYIDFYGIFLQFDAILNRLFRHLARDRFIV